MDRLKEVLAFVNNKGGVGKTTSVLNVATGLIRHDNNLRVLVIDCDPQGNISSLLGWDEHRKAFDNHQQTLYDALMDGNNRSLPVYKAREGLFYVPATDNLTYIEPLLNMQNNSKLVLSTLFGNVLEYMDGRYLDAPEVLNYVQDDFDYVLIDCPPALGALTSNALGAATGLIVPVELDSMSIRGIARIIETYKSITTGKNALNPDLFFRGILLVKADERTNVAKDSIKYIRDTYGDICFSSYTHQCVKVHEAHFIPTDIFTHDPDCRAAKDYAALVEEIIATTPTE